MAVRAGAGLGWSVGAAVTVSAGATVAKDIAGAISHRAALPPLLPFGLSPDEHCQCTLAKACESTPSSRCPCLTPISCLQHRSQLSMLREIRQHLVGRLKELHRRWRPVGLHLKTFQTVKIRQLMAWGDTSLPRDFLFGMSLLQEVEEHNRQVCSQLRRYFHVGPVAHGCRCRLLYPAVDACAVIAQSAGGTGPAHI